MITTEYRVAGPADISIAIVADLHEFNPVNITLRQSRLSGVARATFPDKQSHLVINYCIMF